MNIVLFEREELSEGVVPLSDNRAKHIISVLGKTPGDTFDAGLINGPAGIARIAAVSPGELRFSFTPTSDGKPLCPLEMLVGFPRPIQLKRLFRDMAGLGVSRISLCGTDLGEKSYMDSRIVERGAARRLLLEGAAQAKSTHLCELEVFPTLEDYCARRFGTDVPEGESPPPPGRLCLAADNGTPEISLHDFLVRERQNRDTPVICAVGAERGWTNRERKLLLSFGFTLCGLGERVLRTETACTVAASLILLS